MKKLTILTHPNPILRKPSSKINVFKEEDLNNLAKQMLDTMKKNQGIGLAAPQIGKNIQLFVADWGDGPLILINPKITNASKQLVADEEGCLSVPKTWGLVNRSNTISFKAFNPSGKEICMTLKDLPARIVQHELDHLQGILFIDKILKSAKNIL